MFWELPQTSIAQYLVNLVKGANKIHDCLSNKVSVLIRLKVRNNFKVVIATFIEGGGAGVSAVSVSRLSCLQL